MRRQAAALLLVLACWPGQARATRIAEIPWEKLTLTADFVGIAECVVAGGIVAEYRVIEGWKGAKAGERFRVRLGFDFWTTPFPVTLRGQRFLMTAFRSPPDNVMGTSVMGGVPLWWRDLPADYHLPLWQGRYRVPSNEKDKEWAALRKQVTDLLAAAPEKQEETLLRVAFASTHWWKEAEVELRAYLGRGGSAAEIVRRLLALARRSPREWGLTARLILQEGGRRVALDTLEKAGRLPWDKKESDELFASIRAGLAPKKPEPVPPPGREPEPPSDLKKEGMRLALAKGPGKGSREFSEAFDALTRHDPAFVAGYLRAFTVGKGTLPDRGYELGSFFGWKCGSDRAKHLSSLLDAKDEWVRVAGAVYLCFEDEKAGAAALRKLATLKGNPGAWAALTLARRGEKDAVPRLLRVFGELPTEDRKTGIHELLQARALVLLSNSIRDEAPWGDFDDLVQLWKTHEARAKLGDPWLKELAKRKID